MKLAGAEWMPRVGAPPDYGMDLIRNGVLIAHVPEDELQAAQGDPREIQKAVARAVRKARKDGLITLDESAVVCQFHDDDDQGEDEG